VAALAGVPAGVIERAKARLRELEEAALRHAGQGAGGMQLSLFPPEPDPAPEHPVCEELRGLDPDGLTPRGALDLLYRLKGMLD
jgi:DNA mismatch repair protein MutS